MMRTWRALMVTGLLAFLVAGCFGSGAPSRSIHVEWRNVKSNPGIVSIETGGKRHGYQASTVDKTWIEVEAHLRGATRTQPFTFAVASDDADFDWQQVSDNMILIDPLYAGNGVVLVQYQELQETVPFAIFPTVVLTDDPNPEPGEANGFSFATGQAQPPGMGDIHIDMAARHPWIVYAPYGYAVEDISGSFWGHFIEPRDVRGLTFSPPGGNFEPELQRLYIVRTADGGYAQFFISAGSHGAYARYSIIYNYSPTGIFE